MDGSPLGFMATGLERHGCEYGSVNDGILEVRRTSASAIGQCIPLPDAEGRDLGSLPLECDMYSIYIMTVTYG